MAQDGRLARLRAWAHNGLFGSSRMASQYVRTVQERESTSDEAKALAFKIECDLARLDSLLRARTEPCVERGAMYCSHDATPQCQTDKELYG